MKDILSITKVEELRDVSDIYKQKEKDWAFWGKAYEGGIEFVKEVLTRNVRESKKNWEERQEEGVNFNYTAIVTDLFSFYLSEKPPTEELKKLAKDEIWKLFIKDCDLFGTNFDDFMTEEQKMSSVYGMIGVLIDKPKGEKINRQAEINNNIYPYCCAYTPLNILDWAHERNPKNGRFELAYLKLREIDGTYLLWTKENWARYQINKVEEKESVDLIENGDNPLKEIPFFWLMNIRSLSNPFIGVSDVKEISRITASVIKNVSCGDEIIKYAGFPMLRMPKDELTSQGGIKQRSNIISERSVLEFDPELGDKGKPDWLKTEVAEPIDAILKWISRKIDEMFQLSYLSGVQAHSKSNQPRSGAALKYEYQQLGRVLSKKSNNQAEGKLKIIYFWLKWQKQNELFKDVVVQKSEDFSVDEMEQTLENYMKARQLVYSETFLRVIGKTVAKKMIPESTPDVIEQINKEIEAEPHKPLNRSTADDNGVVIEGEERNGDKEIDSKQMSLSKWAKSSGMSYSEAYKLFTDGKLSVESERLPSGRIIVYP